MKVQIKRIDKSLPLPVYETKGSVAFDISARMDITIPPNSVGLIPSNVIIKVPKSHALILAPRSSTPKKHGLSIPHGIGIIDQDYCGSEDEIKIQMFNFTDKSVTISRGIKIAQGMFVRVDRFDFKEVEDIKDRSRGGFGSTDK